MTARRLLAYFLTLAATVSSIVLPACSAPNPERLASYDVKIGVTDDGYFVDEKISFDFSESDGIYLPDESSKVTSFRVNGNAQSFVVENGLLRFDFQSGKNDVDLSFAAESQSEDIAVRPAYVVNASSFAPFFQPVGYYSDYDLTITAPSSYVVAAPFLSTSRDEAETVVAYDYKAKNVLSFSAFLSKNFIVSEEKSGNKSIKRYVLEEDEEDKDLVRAAFSYFSSALGDYPYEEFVCGELNSACAAGGGASSFVYSGEAEKRFALVRSVACQWFCGKVRQSDDFAPLSDFLSAYCSLAFFSARADESDRAFAEKELENRSLSPSAYAKTRRETEKDYAPVICRAAKDFSDKLEYKATGVDGGVRAMLAAEAVVGRKAVLKNLKKFLSANAYRTVGKKAFLDSFSGFSSCKSVLGDFLNGKVAF